MDKLSILGIKIERLSDTQKQAHARREFDLLQAVLTDAIPPLDAEMTRLGQELRHVNEALWDIEDALREKEATADFGPEFVALARSVYVNNDQRARLKLQINLHLGSPLIEVKSYV